MRHDPMGRPCSWPKEFDEQDIAITQGYDVAKLGPVRATAIAQGLAVAEPAGLAPAMSVLQGSV